MKKEDIEKAYSKLEQLKQKETCIKVIESCLDDLGLTSVLTLRAGRSYDINCGRDTTKRILEPLIAKLRSDVEEINNDIQELL